MRTRFDACFGCLALAGLIAIMISPVAQGQVLPRNKAPAKAAAQPAVPAPGETAGQTRREGRQDARDARETARETGANPRAAARETRQETRQNVQATRAADMGVWFNGRANNGLVISDLAHNGAFSSAGFLAGDRIVSINGQPIATENQFVQTLAAPNLGTQPVNVVVFRNGQQQTLALQPTALTQGIVDHDPLYQYGLVVDDRNPNQILVQRVFPRTPAYYAGLRTGDVITTVGGQPTTNLTAFSQALTQANDVVPLQVTRNGQTRELDLAPNAAAARTALRPNLDTGTRFDGGAAVDQRGGAAATATAPGFGPAQAAPRGAVTVPGGTTTPGAAASSGAAAGTSTAPQPPSATTPDAPATPPAPRAPAGSPATPANPTAPSTPAAPGGSGTTTGTPR